MAAEGQVRALWDEARELSFGCSGGVEQLDSPPSPIVFLRDFVSQNRPCLIRGGASHWPAASLWPLEPYLAAAMGTLPVSLHLTPDGRADALAPHPSFPGRLCFAAPLVRRLPFPDALRSISSPAASPVAYAQQQDDSLRAEYPALAADVDAHLPWASAALGRLPEAVNLWIGGARSRTSFHKDHYENLYAVVSGEKHFLLLPPTEVHRLYVRPYPAARYAASEETGELRLEIEVPERTVPWCSVDPFPDFPESAAASFPLYFDGPPPFRCTVRAGDVLYLPSMWFHHVSQSPDSNGRIIAVNYWYDMQFDIKYAYFNFLQSIRILPALECDDDATETDGASSDEQPT